MVKGNYVKKWKRRQILCPKLSEHFPFSTNYLKMHRDSKADHKQVPAANWTALSTTVVLDGKVKETAFENI